MYNKTVRMVALASLGGLLAFATTAANAALITGTIENNGSNYSLIHNCATPSGCGSWLWFADAETFVFDLSDAGIVTTVGSQSYTLTGNGGVTKTFEIVDLYADLNGSNGFASGYLEYKLEGYDDGKFEFTGAQYGNSQFNSSGIDNGIFQAFMWGGDYGLNDLGIDFSFSGQVPEPGTLLLFAAGLVGFGVSRKRREENTAA